MKLGQSWGGGRDRLEIEQVQYGMTLNRMPQKVCVIQIPIHLDHFLSQAF